MSKIINALQEIALKSGNLTALHGDDSAFSYSEMLNVVHSLAAEFNTLGIERVGLAADNGPKWIIVDLACQLANVPLIPLPGFFTPQQMSHAVESSGVDTLLSDRDDFAHTCTTLFGARLSSGAVAFASLSGISAFRLCPLLNRTPLPDNTAKITYTSGSTGHPKGVCLSVSAQFATAAALNTALRDTPLHRHLAVLPLATLLENVAGVYSALLRGAEVMLPSLATLGWAGSSGLDIQALTSTLTSTNPDSAVLLPQILKGLVSARETGEWQTPASLTFLAVGGARVAPDLIERSRQLGLPVYEGYGLSECGSVVSVNRPGADKPGSAGKILPHCSVDVLDAEIVVSGNTYQGYLQQDGGTPSFTEVPTGDLGELDDDGFLWLRGRSKNLLVNSYGRNISPEWPESELSARPNILQVMVIGDAQAYCSALIYPAPGASNDDINQDIALCNASLPDYAQIRRWAPLPAPLSASNGLLTANGRLRRKEILSHYASLVDSCYSDLANLEADKFTLRSPSVSSANTACIK